MTVVRLGYVAMSVHLKNCSPSQTMTFQNFQKLPDQEAAIRKLGRIARKNLENCLRLLKHNVSHDITFFRFSSKLIPLATHEELSNWDYMSEIKDVLLEIGKFVQKYSMRVDFHPDHFVILNSPKAQILNDSIKMLLMHEQLLKGMNIDQEHRCVLHVGGGYNNKEKALEQFIHNWSFIPPNIQKMIMLENDDVSFTLHETLYLCEKLGLPLVFDYHHHLANHTSKEWEAEWGRVVDTWSHSPLPIKMHMSSPRDEKNFRAHADYIDHKQFLEFLYMINGSIEQIDCMIEAKKKDDALFRLMENMMKEPGIEKINDSTFKFK